MGTHEYVDESLVDIVDWTTEPPSEVGRALALRIRGVGSTFFVSFNGDVQCTIDHTGHALNAQCLLLVILFVPSRQCICCMAQPIRVGESAIDISALPSHGHAHLMAWTQRCAYGATARARRGIFTLSGSEARACANELEDEFEERCGSQKMKSRLMDGGRQMDLALKDAGRRALERCCRKWTDSEVLGEAEAPG